MSSMTSKIVGVALVIGLFAAGLVVGLVLGRSGGSAVKDSNNSAVIRGGSERMIRRFQRRLDLTADQTDKIRAILESSRTRARQIRRKGQEDIKNLLTAEQRTKFEAMIERMNERRAQRRKRRRGRDRRRTRDGR